MPEYDQTHYIIGAVCNCSPKKLRPLDEMSEHMRGLEWVKKLQDLEALYIEPLPR